MKVCFNVFDHLSSSGESSRNSEQFLAACVGQSLLRIRENILKVKLRRFQRTIRYTVTEGLWAKVRKTITNPELIELRPFAYSMLPVAMTFAFRVLQSSSGSDCCDCSSLLPDPAACISSAISIALKNAVTTTAQGAVAGVAGAGASALAYTAADICTRNAIADSHGMPSPSGQASTGEPSPDTSPASTAAAPPVQPPETPPVQPPDGSSLYGNSTLTQDQVKQTIQWGIQHNRSPGDIQNDLNQADKARGGSGQVDLNPDEQPVSQTTPNGEVTMTQKDATEYQTAQLTLGAVNQRASQIWDQLNSLQGEVNKLKVSEGNIGGRFIAGTAQLTDAYQQYQNTLNQIAQTYHKPDPGLITNPEKGLGGALTDSQTQQNILSKWYSTPEGQQALTEELKAQQDFTQKVNQLTGREGASDSQTPPPEPKDNLSNRPADVASRGLERALVGDQPTYATKPTSAQSWWQRPAVKLDQIGQQQQALTNELKQLEIQKRAAIEKMKSITQHGPQDSATEGMKVHPLVTGIGDKGEAKLVRIVLEREDD